MPIRGPRTCWCRKQAPDHLLSRAHPRPAAARSRRDNHQAFTWQQLRDRVAVSLPLAAELTPGAVRVLTVHSASAQRERPWKVAVQGNGNAPVRETTRSGKPWSQEAQYKSAKEVFEEAGLDGHRGRLISIAPYLCVAPVAQGYGCSAGLDLAGGAA